MQLTSPITGAAQTGFTAPTYTHVSDVAPDALGRQVAVSVLGGTQTGATAHSPPSPFTLAWWKPKFFRTPVFNQATGVYTAVGKNVWKYITRKGVTPVAGQSAQVMVISTTIEIPAGAESNDAANIRAGLSAHFGGIAQQSAGFGDSCVTGIQ